MYTKTLSKKKETELYFDIICFFLKLLIELTFTDPKY
jgi:hypothetical protein